MKYLRLIRYQNLLLLALMQLVFRYGFLNMQNIPLALNQWQYGLLVLSTILLAAGGYIINDIFDQGTDTDNRPDQVIVGKQVPEGTAYYLYAALTFCGVFIGMYLSNVIGKPGFISIFIFIAALLYFYATTLKQLLLIGNIVVAALLAFSVLIIGFFDVYPVAGPNNLTEVKLVLSVLKDYALFALLLNFIREIIKDLEDYQGDFNQGMRTLPIVLGKTRTAKLVFVLLLGAIVLLFSYLYNNLLAHELYYAAIYGLVLVLAPLIFTLIQIWQAQQPTQFRQLSQVLKWIILFGILSVAVVTYNIIDHVAK